MKRIFVVFITLGLLVSCQQQTTIENTTSSDEIAISVKEIVGDQYAATVSLEMVDEQGKALLFDKVDKVQHTDNPFRDKEASDNYVILSGNTVEGSGSIIQWNLSALLPLSINDQKIVVENIHTKDGTLYEGTWETEMSYLSNETRTSFEVDGLLDDMQIIMGEITVSPYSIYFEGEGLLSADDSLKVVLKNGQNAGSRGSSLSIQQRDMGDTIFQGVIAFSTPMDIGEIHALSIDGQVYPIIPK